MVGTTTESCSFCLMAVGVKVTRLSCKDHYQQGLDIHLGNFFHHKLQVSLHHMQKTKQN